MTGDISTSSGVTVAGGTLSGTGHVPTVTLNGGTLSPGTIGSPLTINGNFLDYVGAFQLRGHC